jgi:predicted dehydrogenase
LKFTAKRFGSTWHTPSWDEVWFPDAFVGTMAQLLVAIEEQSEPEISGRDNLETIALCEAVFTSAKKHQVMFKTSFGDFQ